MFAVDVDPKLLSFETHGPWWRILHQLNIRLLISREYEHLLISLGAGRSSPEISYFSLAHPSGIAVNRKTNRVYIASTRNPNQIYTFRSLSGMIKRNDFPSKLKLSSLNGNPLLPQATSFYPGSLYIHDLAVIGNRLYANAVGHNAVVELSADNHYEYVWWPKSVDKKGQPDSTANYLQLNSIAPGTTLLNSHFTASCEQPGKLRPGHIRFPVDQKGVVFSGRSRQSVCSGLTRPHSARSYQRKVWLDNSGYGEFGFVDKGCFKSLIKLPGWTRGLCMKEGIAFVGTSRVIPQFYKYAPGLEVEKSVCGIHAVDLKSGSLLASIQWLNGNQIFAIEWLSKSQTNGFPLVYRPKSNKKILNELFYKFQM